MSALDTPTLEEVCLVLFGKSFGVDTQFVCKENHYHRFTPSLSRLSLLGIPLGPSPSGDESAIRLTVPYCVQLCFSRVLHVFHCDSLCNVLVSWQNSCNLKARGSSWRKEQITTEAPTADFCRQLQWLLQPQAHQPHYLHYLNNIFALIANPNTRIKWSRRQLRSSHTNLPTSTAFYTTNTLHHATQHRCTT